jgi:hypothetical protein
VVTASTLAVMLAAGVEVLRVGTIGLWTGVTLVAVSAVAALVTRAGDRSLPAMMPPLAFLAAVLTVGQALPAGDGPTVWIREGVLVMNTLGANASWIIGATLAAVGLSAVRHLLDR